MISSRALLVCNSACSSRLASLCIAAAFIGLSPDACGQTLPPGIIDAPPTVVGDSASIGSDTTLNVMPGGSVGDFFGAGVFGANTNLLVNISGGQVGSGFTARDGSVIDISGGLFGFQGTNFGVLDAESGSQVMVSGGRFDTGFDAMAGSDVDLFGAEFQLNGSPVANGAVVTVTEDDVLSGTLEDGSQFIFAASQRDRIAAATINQTTAPPASPSEITVDDANGPTSLRPGQTLHLEAGGVLDQSFNAVDATINVSDGMLGQLRPTKIASTQLNISGGQVGQVETLLNSVTTVSGGQVTQIDTNVGGTLRISGGTVDQIASDSNSVIEITGGAIGQFDAGRDDNAATDSSTNVIVNISDGTIGNQFDINENSTVNLSGGSIGEDLSAADATLNMIGGAIGADARLLRSYALLRGGTIGRDLRILSGTVTVDGTDIGEQVELDGSPSSRAVLNLRSGSLGANSFAESHSRLNMSGGSLGDNFQAGDENSDSEDLIVNISGGTVGADFQTFSGTTVNVSGGDIGANFSVGDFGGNVDVTANLAGGDFDSIVVGAGAEANLSGGAFGDRYTGLNGSETNLFGVSFAIDGTPITDLIPGTPRTINDRNVVLSGVFLSGEPFAFELNDSFVAGEDLFSFGSVVNITLQFGLPGDYDGNGAVDAIDYAVWRENLGQTGLAPFSPGDGNGDGVVDSGDYDLWRRNFGAAAAANSLPTPEPASGVLLLYLVSLSCLFKKADVRTMRK